MAQLNFPDNPIDGQLYPSPCPVGVTQYKWESSTGIWRIVGVASGVAPGTYGDDVTVAQVTVDVTGRVTDAKNVPIAEGSISRRGLVQLTDSLTSIDDTLALTASGGRSLQLQIGNLTDCIVPDHRNVVAALNDLQKQSTLLQEGALIWCGYYNAQEGFISYVSLTGERLGYRIGDELPTPSANNGGDFFIVTVAGNPYLAGDYNAPNEYLFTTDWILSEKVKWVSVDAGGRQVEAKDVLFAPDPPLTATNVQGALYQITQLFRTGIGGATVSSSKPSNPYPGQLWWDSDDGIFYIYYSDVSGSQWVEAGGGNTGGLQSGGGIYLIETGVGLSGGPITTQGTISLEPAFVDRLTPSLSRIGGVVPNIGFDYSNTTGVLDLLITSDYTGKDPETAFSQEGANLLNAKIDSLSGANVLAGTYDASKGELVFATAAGLARGFVPGENLPPPSLAIDNYYVIVTVGGNVGPEGAKSSQPGDWWICEGDANPPSWFLIDYDTSGQTAANVAVVPIPGIEQASNVQAALGLLELQCQDRVEFVESTSDGLDIVVSPPGPTDYDGTTLSLGLKYASIAQRGIVQLTDDVTGTSDTLVPTQAAISALNSKVDALTGANVLAGTYNANIGTVVAVTTAGNAAGFVSGEQAPDPDRVPDNYYLIVIVSGGVGPPGAVIPPSGVQSGDWFICERAGGTGQWITIDYENRTTTATQVSVDPIPGLPASTVQSALVMLKDEVDQAITYVSSTNDGITVKMDPINADFGFVASFTLNPANTTDIGGVFVGPGAGILLTPSGGLSLLPPTPSEIGGVKAGDNIVIQGDGTISATIPDVQDPPSRLDQLVFDGTTSSFPLRVSGNLVKPANDVSVLICLGGVVQTASLAYTVAGSQINFTEAPAAGTAFYGVLFAQEKG